MFQELSASTDGDCCLFFGLRLLSDDEDDGRSGGNDDSDVLRCRFSLSYLPTPLQADEEEEAEGREVSSSLDRRLREKGAKSFSLTRDFQDFKVRVTELHRKANYPAFAGHILRKIGLSL